MKNHILLSVHTWVARSTFVLGIVLLAHGVRAQSVEVEPNSTKVQATSAFLDPVAGGTAAQLMGTTTGSQMSSGVESLDVWRVVVPPAATGVYRCQLALTSETQDHVLTLRGLTQTPAGIDSLSNTLLQAAEPSSYVLSWYSFAAESSVFVHVVGNVGTNMPYTATLTRTPVVPVVIAAPVRSGQVTVRVNGVAGGIDTECWLYDANFEPLVANVPPASGPGGADDALAGAGLTSFVRTLAPGTYYAAVGEFNLSNNFASFPGDYPYAPVPDGPGVLVSSVVNRGVAASVTLSLTDSAGATATSSVLSFPAGSIGLVHFVRFTVAAPAGPDIAGCTASPALALAGTSVTLTATVAPGTSSAAIVRVDAGLSAFGITEPVAMVAGAGGTYSAEFGIPATQAVGAYSIPVTAKDAMDVTALCNASLRVIAPADECSIPVALALGTPVSSTTVGMSASTQASSSCAPGATVDAFFTFTPTEAGVYEVRLTPGLNGAALAVGTSCTPFVDTQACHEVSLAPIRTRPLSLQTGERIVIRVSSPAGSESAFTIAAALAEVGACCDEHGVCSVTQPEPFACVGGVFRGVGTTCVPGICPVAGACCTESFGVCTLVLEQQCSAGSAFLGAGTACVPWACPARANDACENAATILPGLALHSVAGATTGLVQPTCGAITGDIWYTWTAPADGTLRFVSMDNAPDHSAMYAVSGASACPSGGDELVCQSSGAALSTGVTRGTTYAIQVGRGSSEPTTVTGRDLWFVRSVTGACCAEGGCVNISGAECPAGAMFTPGIVCHAPLPEAARLHTYVGPGITIADYSEATGATFASSSVTVTDTFTVSEVEVLLTGAHAYVGDLVVELRTGGGGGVGGRVIELFNRPRRELVAFGSDANLTSAVLTFSDAAQRTLSAGSATLAPNADLAAATYLPASIAGLPLSFKHVFNGESAEGVWTLTVSDWASGDFGSLNWTLKLREGAASTCPVVVTGRCCVGARCTSGSSAANCVAGVGSVAGVTFTAGATTCNLTSVFNGPCCFADYNKGGGVTTQDIFDYLSDWFNAHPNAKLQGDGVGTPTVTDIFNFIAAWFAGCA